MKKRKPRQYVVGDFRVRTPVRVQCQKCRHEWAAKLTQLFAAKRGQPPPDVRCFSCQGTNTHQIVDPRFWQNI